MPRGRRQLIQPFDRRAEQRVEKRRIMRKRDRVAAGECRIEMLIDQRFRLLVFADRSLVTPRGIIGCGLVQQCFDLYQRGRIGVALAAALISETRLGRR